MHNPEENENQVSEVVTEPTVSETPSILVAPAEEEGKLSPNPAGSGFTSQKFVDSLPVTGKPNVLYCVNRKTADGSIVGYTNYRWNKATKAYERVYGDDPYLQLFLGDQKSSTDTHNYEKNAPAKIFDGDVLINGGTLKINGKSIEKLIEEEGRDGGTVVHANPTLAGTETYLSGLEVAGTKYKVITQSEVQNLIDNAIGEVLYENAY